MADGLEVEDLSVSYGGNHAVQGLSLTVPRGTIVGLIGPNGAGKTTTFNACCGLLKPTTGTVRLDGTDITAMPPQQRAQRGLGRTFQKMELFGSLDVRANIGLGLEARLAGAKPLQHVRCRRDERARIDEVTEGALDLCGIQSIADRSISTLSTGQRRLVELARGIAGGFDLLLLDEPSSGLDVAETAAFGEVLATLVASQGVGILLVEHDMSLVMKLCSNLFVIDFGVPIFTGPPAEAQVSDAVRAAYLGAAT